MQQSGTDGGRAKAKFIYHNPRHCERMHYVRLATATPHPLVSLACEFKGTGYQLHLLAMVTGEISLQKFTESAIYIAAFFRSLGHSSR